jgi:hypothetical protein
MKVDIFCICDFAQPGEQGKLNIIGIFDSLIAENLPAIHGLFAIAIKLRVNDVSEISQKKFKISFLAPDKTPIAPDIESVISTPLNPNVSQTNIQFVALIPHLNLPQFGEYSVVLQIDEQRVASTHLYLRQTVALHSHLLTPPQTA